MRTLHQVFESIKGHIDLLASCELSIFEKIGVCVLVLWTVNVFQKNYCLCFCLCHCYVCFAYFPKLLSEIIDESISFACIRIFSVDTNTWKNGRFVGNFQFNFQVLTRYVVLELSIVCGAFIWSFHLKLSSQKLFDSFFRALMMHYSTNSTEIILSCVLCSDYSVPGGLFGCKKRFKRDKGN